MKFMLLLLGVAAAMPSQVGAVPTRTQTGTANGLTYTAETRVIGQTSTATIAGGGNPLYLAQQPRYSGVVGLLMDYGAGGQFVCSGSLNGSGNSIITAGHCVSDGTKARPDSVTAFFYNGDPSDQPVYSPGAIGVTTVAISGIHVNPLYTGEVIDQNDIAVLRLASAAPAFAQRYDLYTGGDLTGLDYNIAGYGSRSDTGGIDGVTPPHGLGTGRLRQGDNRYDFRLGDPDFAGFFAGGPAGFFGTADTSYSYIADFDNGLSANDGSCGLVTAGFGFSPSSKYCNLGRGASEVSTAGGDSGGPQFIDGKLASVTSYGLGFGSDFGDVDDALNDTFGEFNGFVPTFIHAAWIASVVPEAPTWAMMISGFGMVGAMARRRRVVNVA